MTRPVAEPTTQRALSGQGYTNRQLLRRPGPRTGFTVAYAWISQQNNQDDPIPTDSSLPVSDIGAMTDGFSSDPSILYPDLATGVIYLSDINFSPASSAHNTPGYYIAHANVFGWDVYTGVADTVCDAAKGTGVTWQCSNLDGKSEVMNIDPACGTGCALIAGTESVMSDAAIVSAASNNNVFQVLAQCSGVDAAISSASLYVALIQDYPTATGVYYTP